MVVRAVLLDLGDTLIFEAHAPDRARLFGAMAEQVRPLLRAWDALDNVDLPALLGELYDAMETAQPAWRARGLEVDSTFIAQGALATYGVDVAPEEAAQFWRGSSVDLAAWGWQSYPDTAETLRRLRSLDLRVALVSNSWWTSDLLGPMFESVGFGVELFDAIVTSSDVGKPKPDPALFERALAALGVTPGDAAFVGDDLECDVRGAKALGMATVWKLNGRHEVPPAPEADFAIHDLWELFTLHLLPEGEAAGLPQESLMPHEDGNANRY